jgi:hypothetical protein
MSERLAWCLGLAAFCGGFWGLFLGSLTVGAISALVAFLALWARLWSGCEGIDDDDRG